MIGPLENVVERAMDVVKQKISILATALENFLIGQFTDAKNFVLNLLQELFVTMENDVLALIDDLVGDVETFARQMDSFISVHVAQLERNAQQAAQSIGNMFQDAEGTLTRAAAMPSVVINTVVSGGSTVESYMMSKVAAVEQLARTEFANIKNQIESVMPRLPSVGTVVSNVRTEIGAAENYMGVELSKNVAPLAESMLHWIAIVMAIFLTGAMLYFTRKIVK